MLSTFGLLGRFGWFGFVHVDVFVCFLDLLNKYINNKKYICKSKDHVMHGEIGRCYFLGFNN